MRLFIAQRFDTDAPAAARVAAARDRLREMAETGSFVPDENLHLTLAFLGEVDEGRIEDVEEAIDTVTGSFTSELAFCTASRWPQKSGKRYVGDVWKLDAEANSRLAGLQRAIARALTKAGFELPERDFAPHVTLARRVLLAESAPDVDEAARIVAGDPFAARLSTVSLMESQLRPDRPPQYSEICAWE